MCAPILFWQWLLLIFLCGMYFAVIPWISFLLFVVLCLFWTPDPKKIFISFLAFCAGLIFFICHLFFFSPPTASLPDEKGHISGTIVSVQYKTGQRLQCILKDVVWQPASKKNEKSCHKVAGRVVLTWQYPLFFPVPGQTLRANVKVKPVHGMRNAGGWNSEWYWRQRGVFWRAFTKADKGEVHIEGQPAFYHLARQKIRDFLLRNLPDNSGRGLALALLLGERLYIQQNVQEKLQRAGLAHSLALSGMHVGIVASFGLVLAWVIGFFWPRVYLVLPRSKLAVICAAPLVLFYLWLGGAGLSLQRAAMMFAVWGAFLLLNRNNILLDGLFVALGCICLFNPLALFDVSLQMSVLAVVGIALFLPFWRRLTSCFLYPSLRYITLLFGVTLGANIALFPVLVWNFNMFSPHLLYNLVWLPVLGLIIMPLLFGGLVLAPVMESASGFCLRAGSDLLDLFVRALHWLDNLGWLKCLIVPRPFPEMALAWWAGFFWIFCLGCGQKAQQTTRVAGVLFVLALLGSLIRLGAPYLNRDVRLHLLDTGMSQAVLLSLPHGQRILVDGGGFWNTDFDVGRSVVAPRLTLGRWPDVEKIVLTHDDADHRRGLIFLLRHFQIGSFVWNGRELSGRDGQTIRAALQNRRIPATVWQQGNKIHLDAGLVLEVLWPPRAYTGSDNNLSLVLRLSRNGHGLVLLPGDIENPALRQLLKTDRDLQADVLVVPHHGSRGSLLPELYERVRPKYALVAAGFLNRFHFPHQQVTEFCRAHGIELLTTATSGEITVTWPRNGGQMRLDCQRRKKTLFELLPFCQSVLFGFKQRL